MAPIIVQSTLGVASAILNDALFIFAIATPDYLVDEMWDKTFLRSPFVSLWKMFSFKIHKKS